MQKDSVKNCPFHGKNMGRIADADMAQFSIRLLDDACQRMMPCPTTPMISRNHNFMFLLKGEALIDANSQQYLMFANECITVPAGTQFSIRYFKDCFGYMGSFSTDFLCANPLVANSFRGFAFLQSNGVCVTGFDYLRSGFVQVLLERIYSETLSVPQSDDVIRANLNSFLVEIAAESAKKQSKPVSLGNDTCGRFIDMVFCKCHYRMPASEYAEKLNVTVDYLNKAVKSGTGKSVADWIEEATMVSAKMMLRNTDLSISEIASELGILDQSYFTRRFKLHEKMSPTDYRKIVRNNH